MHCAFYVCSDCGSVARRDRKAARFARVHVQVSDPYIFLPNCIGLALNLVQIVLIQYIGASLSNHKSCTAMHDASPDGA